MTDTTSARRLLPLPAAIALAVLLLPLAAQPAAASVWIWGGGFRVGGVHFEIGYRPTPVYHYRGHRHVRPPAGYYYQVARPLRAPHRCTTHCYVHRGKYYHHRSCPVVYSHLRRHAADPHVVFSRHAPHPHRHDYRYRYERHDRRGKHGHDDHWRKERYRHR